MRAKKNNGHMIWFSGKDDKHESGVGFLANKKIVGAV